MIIDGKKVPWMFGESVLDAATKAGIYIPTLCCDTSFLVNDSCCRLCMVEIMHNGSTFLAPACATETEAEMEITTNSDALKKIRRTILQLIYAEAPGNKAIMDIMDKCGVQPNVRIPLKEGRDCILCGRCVNACNTWVKGAISRIGRGINLEINTPFCASTDECVGCASCELVCPLKTIETEDTSQHRKIWNNEFSLIYCEQCGKLLTTAENYNDAFYADAPSLCNECSEEYRKKHRKNEDLYCD